MYVARLSVTKFDGPGSAKDSLRLGTERIFSKIKAKTSFVLICTLQLDLDN